MTKSGVFIGTDSGATTSKTGGVWANGLAPPAGLPFGEPGAQSAGAGFLPALPAVSLPWLSRILANASRMSQLSWSGSSAPGGIADRDEANYEGRVSTAPRFAPPRPGAAAAGPWLLLAAFAAVLLVLGMTG